MKQTVNSYDFEQAFRNAGRFGGENDNFSYQGLQLLFDYLAGWEEDTEEEIELDVIALCCEFTEATKEELIANFGEEIGLHSLNNEEEDDEQIEEYLNENTMYVGKTEPNKYSKIKEPTYIYQSF
tara:strand:- start:216 stop:590 length:375 start_codon:yes stop_codon:yes gene_type:complete